MYINDFACERNGFQLGLILTTKSGTGNFSRARRQDAGSRAGDPEVHPFFDRVQTLDASVLIVRSKAQP